MSLPITLQQTKAILREILGVIESRENLTILHQFMEHGDNDAVAQAQNAFPFITKIQQDVISRHGFSSDEHGFVEFIHCVHLYEQQDQDIAMMANKIKAYSIPPLRITG